MVPTREEALEALREAESMNPGQWVDHVKNTALAAEAIASRCPGMDAEKAYVLGLLHDIGRRVGVVSMKHVIAGYEYAMRRGWDEVAKICMTHSYPIQDTTRRYGIFPFTVERWNATFAIKEAFEKKMGCSVYSVLPGIGKTTLL